MARALIRANAHLAGHPRGEVREVELTDLQIARAASGQISIVKTWGEGVQDLAERVEDATVDEVLGWVESGKVDAAEVLQAEMDGKQRRGIVDRLASTGSGPASSPAAAEGDAGVIGSDEVPGAAEGI